MEARHQADREKLERISEQLEHLNSANASQQSAPSKKRRIRKVIEEDSGDELEPGARSLPIFGRPAESNMQSLLS